MLKATPPSVILVKASPLFDLDLELETQVNNVTNDSVAGIQPPYWSLTDRIVFATVLSIMMVVALVGNILVLTVVIKNRGMRTRTNMFLCNLAVADLFCASVDMPISLVTMIYGDWIFSDAMCQFNGFALPFFFVASIHTLMYIGIHKYVSIRYPLGQILTRNRVRMMMGAAWLWATIAGYVTVHGLNTVEYKPRTAQCGPSYPSNSWTYVHLGFVVITCYLVPLVILAVCYIGMFREIKALSLRMAQNTTMEKELIYVQQRRITMTLLIVLLFFLICWTPYIIYSLTVSFLQDKATIHKYANPMSYWCGYLSSACNPMIYGLMSPAFREGYKELLCQVNGEMIVSDGSHAVAFQPFGQFRSFLQQYLGNAAQDSDSSIGSTPVSRKTSFTSIANFVLFPKSRTMSTNSLPRNFAYSVSLPGRFQQYKEHGQISLMARLTKVLNGEEAATSHQEVVRPQVRAPVYYPPTLSGPHMSTKADIEIHIETVEEEDGLSTVPIAEQEDYEVEVAPLLDVDKESGLLTLYEPDSMVVENEVVVKRSISGIRSPSSISQQQSTGLQEDSTLENKDSCPSSRRTSQTPSQPKRDSLFGDRLFVPDETRQWFSKSLSEEGRRGDIVEGIDKSPSDTCIVGQKDRILIDQDREDKPAKLNIFRRLFSKSSSSSEDRKRSRHTVTGESVTSVEDSPKAERRTSTGILKKYLRSVSADPTRRSIQDYPKFEGGRHLCYQSEFPHRSASDPALLERKKSRWKKIKNKYSLKKKNKRKSAGEVQCSSTEKLDIGKLVRSKSERSPTKLQRHPSIEKLDTMNQESLYESYTGLSGCKKYSNYSAKKKLMDRRCVSHEVVRGTDRRKHSNEKVRDALCGEVLQEHEVVGPRIPICLIRSASDPGMTFQMIEEKVMQRVATKKWNRKRKSTRTATAHKLKENKPEINGCVSNNDVPVTESSNKNNNNPTHSIPFVCIIEDLSTPNEPQKPEDMRRHSDAKPCIIRPCLIQNTFENIGKDNSVQTNKTYVIVETNKLTHTHGAEPSTSEFGSKCTLHQKYSGQSGNKEELTKTTCESHIPSYKGDLGGPQKEKRCNVNKHKDTSNYRKPPSGDTSVVTFGVIKASDDVDEQLQSGKSVTEENYLKESAV